MYAFDDRLCRPSIPLLLDGPLGAVEAERSDAQQRRSHSSDACSSLRFPLPSQHTHATSVEGEDREQKTMLDQEWMPPALSQLDLASYCHAACASPSFYPYPASVQCHSPLSFYLSPAASEGVGYPFASSPSSQPMLDISPASPFCVVEPTAEVRSERATRSHRETDAARRLKEAEALARLRQLTSVAGGTPSAVATVRQRKSKANSRKPVTRRMNKLRILQASAQKIEQLEERLRRMAQDTLSKENITKAIAEQIQLAVSTVVADGFSSPHRSSLSSVSLLHSSSVDRACLGSVGSFRAASSFLFHQHFCLIQLDFNQGDKPSRVLDINRLVTTPLSTIRNHMRARAQTIRSAVHVG